MEPVRESLITAVIPDAGGDITLTLDREDFSALYPGLVRFVLRVSVPDGRAAVFRTNTFEYSPVSSQSAESVARQKALLWQEALGSGTKTVFQEYKEVPQPVSHGSGPEVIVLQGSPRPDGSCGILALWAAEAARAAGRTVAVIYPHDLDIHGCIGCYQCFNTGTCVYDDDMEEIISALRTARLLVVCTPVYTNTVPGALKLLIDRIQAYSAERLLYGGTTGQTGLLLSTAGRKGAVNFTCITRVIVAFFHAAGITPAGSVLVDRTDAVKDIRTLPGLEEEVRGLVTKNL